MSEQKEQNEQKPADIVALVEKHATEEVITQFIEAHPDLSLRDVQEIQAYIEESGEKVTPELLEGAHRWAQIQKL